MTPSGTDLLATLERYYDEVPRATARAEDLGPFTLFVQERTGGWPLYARPRLAPEGRVTDEAVARVRARQRELGVPESFEWVEETTPELGEALERNGLTVHHYPLLVLDEHDAVTAAPPGFRVRVLEPDSPDLAAVTAAVSAGFGDTDTVVESADDPAAVRALMAAGRLRAVGAFDSHGAVGGGTHQPRSGVSELMGIGVIPRARKRGVGASVTTTLVADAREAGAGTLFLTAGSDAVARIYERVGFQRVATAGIAANESPDVGTQSG